MYCLSRHKNYCTNFKELCDLCTVILFFGQWLSKRFHDWSFSLLVFWDKDCFMAIWLKDMRTKPSNPSSYWGLDIYYTATVGLVQKQFHWKIKCLSLIWQTSYFKLLKKWLMLLSWSAFVVTENKIIFLAVHNFLTGLDDRS